LPTPGAVQDFIQTQQETVREGYEVAGRVESAGEGVG